MKCFSGYGLAVMLSGGVLAQDSAPTSLPSPLSLEQAWQWLQQQQSPLQQSLEAQHQLARAEQQQAESGQALEVDLKGRLRQVGVSDLGNPDQNNDSAVSLFVRQPISDFGRSRAQLQAADLGLQAEQWSLEAERQRQKLALMKAFFAVLLADLEFARDNENLATAFIRFDRTRENAELGLHSEIEVVRLQHQYELVRQARYRSQNQQRLTRQHLANLLGVPEQAPNELLAPDIPPVRPVKDVIDELTQAAIQSSVSLQAQRLKERQAQARWQAAQKQFRPNLDAELELSHYEKPTAMRDDWRASLYFSMPLYRSAEARHAETAAKARWQQEQLNSRQLEADVRAQVLQLWQQLQIDQLSVEGAQVQQEYREYYLDRSRAEYELEYKTDLGDAMVQFSASRHDLEHSRFQWALTWQELEFLVGAEAMQQYLPVSE